VHDDLQIFEVYNPRGVRLKMWSSTLTNAHTAIFCESRGEKM